MARSNFSKDSNGSVIIASSPFASHFEILLSSSIKNLTSIFGSTPLISIIFTFLRFDKSAQKCKNYLLSNGAFSKLGSLFAKSIVTDIALGRPACPKVSKFTS